MNNGAMQIDPQVIIDNMSPEEQEDYMKLYNLDEDVRPREEKLSK